VRIALVAPLVTPIADPPEGGSQAVVADLARALADRGHEVVLYASRGSRVDGIDVVSLDIDPSQLHQDMHRHGTPRVPSAALVTAYRDVYAHLARSRWDVIHSHGFDVPAVIEPARLGIAVLHTLHLPPTDAMVAALASARSHGVRTWCVSVSRSCASSWAGTTTVDGVLPNGVPVDDIGFAPKAARRALIASRCSPEKGLADGIAVARRAGWPVDVFATPYDREYERLVRRRWKDDADVTFHSPAPRRGLWAAMAAAGAVLCLSRWDEPFGMVAAEAQAAGTPVVATRRGGLAEVVRDGVTGHLVPTDDFEAAGAALDRTGELDRAACRRHATANLSLFAAVERHEQMYAALWGSSRPTAGLTV